MQDLVRARTRGLIAILAAAVLLVGGWPLLNAALGDETEPLRNGARLTLGDAARFTVGPGWTLRTAESDPDSSYLLERGTVRLRLSLVTPPRDATPAQLWEGLGRVAEASGEHVELGEPVPFGRRGLRGPVAEGRAVGTATVQRAPDGGGAAETTALGEPGTAADHRAADNVAASLRWLEGS
ncbi:hypothetical protein [Actinomadura flavalba]|uniref:hypothetical protein n=1 Tax=Actinomadura flavalba TaxID=1120938 RepID=UPI001F0B2AC8|nr:hypothetical protein [Actinomadura flavalba]